MKTEQRRVPAVFGAETRFAIKPVVPASLLGRREREFEQLKSRLVGRHLLKAEDVESSVQVRRAANEAAALAWSTAFPLLLFPVLFEEKAATALAQVERQRQIRERSRELVAF
jgi:hypothetical protein